MFLFTIDANFTVTEVTFNVGSGGELQCVNITLLDDSLLEGIDSVTFEFSSDDAVISRNISLLVQDGADAEGIVNARMYVDMNPPIFQLHPLKMIVPHTVSIQALNARHLAIRCSCRSGHGQVLCVYPASIIFPLKYK